jgi:CDP-2,3-bis-(O-geranylgeranyl)-sn-glycerol synthase
MKSQYIFYLLAVVYTLLPAYLANMAPVFAQRLQWFSTLAVPIDGNKMLFGKPILGKGKTWRGLIVGTVIATATVIVQTILQDANMVEHIRLIDYSTVNPLYFGILAGVGALGGDIVKSFVKRRVNIASGNAWPVFDQLDFVIGFFVLTLLVVPWNQNIVWTAIIITLAGHPISNIIGYSLHIKKVWW